VFSVTDPYGRIRDFLDRSIVSLWHKFQVPCSALRRTVLLGAAVVMIVVA
jgi:hypothetical protein